MTEKQLLARLGDWHQKRVEADRLLEVAQATDDAHSWNEYDELDLGLMAEAAEICASMSAFLLDGTGGTSMPQA